MRRLVGWIIVALAFILCLVSLERLLSFLSTFTL